MKKLALTLSVLAVFSGTVQAQGDATKGQQVASTTCIACHGMDGNSLISLYPKVAGQHQGYLVKQLQELKQAAMTGGKEGRHDPIMSGMAMTLTEEQMADVAAFYASQTSTAGVSIDAQTASAGKKLYMAGDASRQITACAACHGPNGEGMNLAGYPSLAGQHPDYIKAQLEKFRSGVRHNDLNGMMSGVAKNLKDEDIALLSQYVSSLK
ncbi:MULTISPECIES: cytochrome c [Ferrimonas]|uniref:c-type cytochrome n=1 Tax=Ferrimonas TaxID=44011 RepID=UPI0003FA0A00|nr:MULTISPECIES: c-type cytochrome [Ferrimonas]USD37449.1 cytochrome c4 [Ferrimonas sp. SCSIO 43195]